LTPCFARKTHDERLEECLRDEPDWAGVLYVEPVELDEGDVSAN
jgi:hypothetical protein